MTQEGRVGGRNQSTLRKSTTIDIVIRLPVVYDYNWQTLP